MSIVGESRLAVQTTTDGFYSPLLGQRDIRLLEVLSGDDESTIVTSMVTVSLESKPTYAALSYVWGDATQTSTIECNGKFISITTSLAEALRAFRSFSDGLDAPLKSFKNKIWVDQLCINQHDVLERNHQVGIMGSVYSSSACAFIWLGPGDVDCDRALSFVDTLSNRLDEHRVRPDGVDHRDSLQNAVSRSDSEAWAELAALFSRPWFERCWTVQEAIRAPDRAIACGSKIRNWRTFVSAALVCLYTKYPEITTASINALVTIHKYILTKSEDLRLSDLIYATRHRKASDARDKVYALYGLVQDYHKATLKISYAMSVEDVYRSAVRFCIESERNLFILTLVSLFRCQSNLPSWVPDWRDQSQSGCSPVGERSNSDFHASSMSLPLLVPSSSSDKLILKGFVLAIIERTINAAALRINPADSSPDSWRTNAAAAGVPACFLQGKTFETSFDRTTTVEESPFHNNVNQAFAKIFFPNCVRWLAVGRPDPVPQAVLTEYKLNFNACTRNRCLILSKDALGPAPAPTQVGDRVCILLGGDAPFILRPRQNSARATPCKEAEPEPQDMSSAPTHDTAHPAQDGLIESPLMTKEALEATEWTLIGDCYLNGYMRGEAMKNVTEADYVNFALV